MSKNRFLSDLHETWIYLSDFRKIFKYQISWKSVHAYGRTDRTKLIVAFRLWCT